MGSSKFRKQSKLMRCLKRPLKILARARDLYVQNMSSSGGVQVFSGGAMSCPTPQLRSLSRNTSKSSSNSSRSKSSDEPSSKRGRVVPVHRSYSVPNPFGRIDEEETCDFGVDDVPEVVYPKSRSCVATSTSKF